jgi:hypothetical protein
MCIEASVHATTLQPETNHYRPAQALAELKPTPMVNARNPIETLTLVASCSSQSSNQKEPENTLSVDVSMELFLKCFTVNERMYPCKKRAASERLARKVATDSQTPE